MIVMTQLCRPLLRWWNRRQGPSAQRASDTPAPAVWGGRAVHGQRAAPAVRAAALTPFAVQSARPALKLKLAQRDARRAVITGSMVQVCEALDCLVAREGRAEGC
jgi:hypothetical protein